MEDDAERFDRFENLESDQAILKALDSLVSLPTANHWKNFAVNKKAVERPNFIKLLAA